MVHIITDCLLLYQLTVSLVLSMNSQSQSVLIVYFTTDKRTLGQVIAPVSSFYTQILSTSADKYYLTINIEKLNVDLSRKLI